MIFDNNDLKDITNEVVNRHRELVVGRFKERLMCTEKRIKQLELALKDEQLNLDQLKADLLDGSFEKWYYSEQCPNDYDERSRRS